MPIKNWILNLESCKPSLTMPHTVISLTHRLIFRMTPQHQIVKIGSVKVWVTRLPSLSHPPLSMWRHRVTCLPPKNASAPWGGPGLRWLTIIKWQVSYIQYPLACHKSQRSTSYNIVKNGLPWKRVFRRRHLGGGWLQSPASDGPPWTQETLQPHPSHPDFPTSPR